VIEQATYWVCACETANHVSSKACTDCGKPKPRIWLLKGSVFVAFAFIGLLAIAGRHEPNDNVGPKEQSAYLELLASSRSEAHGISNHLKRRQFIRYRNDRILQDHATMRKWVGKVKMIKPTVCGASVSFDVGDSVVTTGSSCSNAVATSSKLYASLMQLKSGASVEFSGEIRRLENARNAIHPPKIIAAIYAVEPFGDK